MIWVVLMLGALAFFIASTKKGLSDNPGERWQFTAVNVNMPKDAWKSTIKGILDNVKNSSIIDETENSVTISYDVVTKSPVKMNESFSFGEYQVRFTDQKKIG